jgi:hypothetical protein
VGFNVGLTPIKVKNIFLRGMARKLKKQAATDHVRLVRAFLVASLSPALVTKRRNEYAIPTIEIAKVTPNNILIITETSLPAVSIPPTLLYPEDIPPSVCFRTSNIIYLYSP